MRPEGEASGRDKSHRISSVATFEVSGEVTQQQLPVGGEIAPLGAEFFAYPHTRFEESFTQSPTQKMKPLARAAAEDRDHKSLGREDSVEPRWW